MPKPAHPVPVVYDVMPKVYEEPYKIETGVPLPRLKNTRKYPFDKMKVGDSFFVPNGKIGTIGNAVFMWNREHRDSQFISRSVEGGVRVWRTK